MSLRHTEDLPAFSILSLLATIRRQWFWMCATAASIPSFVNNSAIHHSLEPSPNTYGFRMGSNFALYFRIAVWRH